MKVEESLTFKSRQLDMSRSVEGTYLFTGANAQKGYHINKFCMSLTVPANRDAFQADKVGYMKSFGMSDAEVDMVENHDWLGLVKAGAHHFMVFKVAGAHGYNLTATGARMRGETVEQYLASRHVTTLTDNTKDL